MRDKTPAGEVETLTKEQLRLYFGSVHSVAWRQESFGGAFFGLDFF